MKKCHGIFVECKGLIEKESNQAPIPRNMPTSSGAIRWASGILDRFVPKFIKFQELSESLYKSEEYLEVVKLYEAIKEKIEKYQEEKKLEFYQFVNNKCVDKLDLKLLKYNEEDKKSDITTKSLQVNFDQNLVRLLKEVKYFLQFGYQIPNNAQDIYDKADQYRDYVWTLDEIVFMYNIIQSELNVVERPLVAKNIDSMDESLKPGTDVLTWKQDIQGFLSKGKKKVESVYKIMQTMKTNLNSIYKHLEKKKVVI